MRYKALPPSLRGALRAPPPNHPLHRSERSRAADWLATLVMVILLPALAIPMLSSGAATLTLQVAPDPAEPGAQIVLTAANLAPRSRGYLMFDGSSVGLPTYRADRLGGFQVVATIPLGTAAGSHTIGIVESRPAKPGGPNASSVASDIVVLSRMITVSALPTPPPLPTATPIALPTASPIPVTPVFPTAIAVPATPTPTTAPVPTPAPTATPAPVPVVNGAYYVSPSGSDANPGTLASPFRTVLKGLTVVGPGQTLYVRGGTYVEDIKNPPIRPGTPSARVSVVAYPGERPVVQGLLWLMGPSYWTLDGINVTWRNGNSSVDHMVRIINGVGWEFRNAEIWGARSFAGLLVAGTTVGQPAGWRVSGNCIHDTYPANAEYQDHNMYINTGLGAGAGTVDHNVMFNATNGENIKVGGGTSAPTEGSANVTVSHNTFYNGLQPILLADGSRNIVFERNIVTLGTNGYAMRAYHLSGTGNTFRDNVFSQVNRLQQGDSGYALLTDGGGNLFPLDPLFTGVGCAMRPTDAVAVNYGR